MTLSQYIDKLGRQKIATAIGVDQMTVYRWQLMLCLPSAKNMQDIVEYSRGVVTYDNIIDPFLAASIKPLKAKLKKKK